MNTNEPVAHSDSPAEVARATQGGADVSGDAADQAERLTMVMEAEAVRAALAGQSGGEGSLEGLDYPLEDTEDLIAMEDADDASDDPMHAGGMQPAAWLSAEQAAMHVVDEGDPTKDRYVDEIESDAPDVDPFDRPEGELTPEDQTLLGIDPYDQ
jgi:hypothetical protein